MAEQEKRTGPDLIPPEENRPPNVLPATEVARNPNPRANENLPQPPTPDGQMEDAPAGVGSEITDGEDA
jgi:hypothetical protein